MLTNIFFLTLDVWVVQIVTSYSYHINISQVNAYVVQVSNACIFRRFKLYFEKLLVSTSKLWQLKFFSQPFSLYCYVYVMVICLISIQSTFSLAFQPIHCTSNNYLLQLFVNFQINLQTIENFLNRVEQGYLRYGNPYHNNLHAADVAQTVHYMLCQTGLMVSISLCAPLTSLLYDSVLDDYILLFDSVVVPNYSPQRYIWCIWSKLLK